MNLLKSKFIDSIKFEYKITFAYLVVGFLWIIFSDFALELIVDNPALITDIQTYKGWFYVGVTAFILFALVRRHNSNLNKSNIKRIEGESRFNSLFYENLSVILIINPDTGKIVNANNAACAFYGWPHEELCNKFIHEINNLDRNVIVNHLQNAKNKINNHLQLKHSIASGEVRDIEVFSGPISFDDSTLLYAFIHDITDKVKLKSALKEQEIRIRTINDNFSSGMIYQIRMNYDGTRKFTYLSESVKELYGITPEQGMADPSLIYKHLHPEDVELMAEAEEKALREFSSFIAEARIISPNGKIRWASFVSKPTKLTDGSVSFDGIEFDITNRKNAENELLLSKVKLQAALSSMTDAVFISDSDGNFIEFNEAFAQFHKFKNKDECATTFSEYSDFLEVYSLEGNLISIENWAVSRALRGEIVKNAEFKLLRKDTGESWFGSYSFSPIFSAEGKIIGSVVTARDVTERMLVEASLRESEEKFRKAFLTNPDSITINRLSDGMYYMVNVGFTQIFGYTEAEILGKTSIEINIWQELSMRKIFVDILKESGYIENFEAVLVSKSGKLIDCLVSSTVIEINGSTHILSTTKDITERKLANEALKISELRYRNIFETAIIGIYRTNVKGEILMANPTLVAMLEFDSFEELSKRNLESEGFKSTLERKQYIQKIEKYGSISGFESVWLTKNGKAIIVNENAKVITDAEGKVLYYEGSIEDITERKRAEEALRTNEILLSEVGRLAKVGGWEFYPESGIGSWTDEVARIHEIDPVDGINVSDGINYYYGESKKIISKAVKEISELALPYDLELEICTAKGNHKWIRTIGHPILENGKVIKVHGSFQDITERKLAEEAITKLNETLELRVKERTIQLEAINNELEAFSYSVSHDLRAPLRHINGFVDLLSEKYQDLLPEKGKHYIDVIVDSSRHMGSLIDDLLQFSRTGRQELKKTTFSMSNVIREVIDMAQSDINQRNIEWKIQGLPNATADLSLIRLVWFNLISNAIKFTKNKEKAIIEIGFLSNQNEYEFYIKDNGAGFDMRYAHKLFGVFQRLHSKHEFEGTGIGLANVQRIIFKHGGKVWADSKINKGATFYFTLPTKNEINYD